MKMMTNDVDGDNNNGDIKLIVIAELMKMVRVVMIMIRRL